MSRLADHTPLPWQYSSGSVYAAGRTDFDKETLPIAHMDRTPGNGTYGAERDANARFIVHAVNCHVELLAAVTMAHDELVSMRASGDSIADYTVFESLAATIAKAKGGG